VANFTTVHSILITASVTWFYEGSSEIARMYFRIVLESFYTSCIFIFAKQTF